MSSATTGDAAGSQTGDRRPLPAAAALYTPYLWVIVIAPLVTSALSFTWQPDFRLEHLGGPTGPLTVSLASVLTPGYFILMGGSLVVYLICAIFAWLDERALRARGVERPFSWGWSFLGGIVYVIGRSVIVHKVARPRGLIPIWVAIAVTVAGVVLGGIWDGHFLSELSSQLRNLA